MAAPVIAMEKDAGTAGMRDTLRRQRRAFLDQGSPSAEIRIDRLDRLIRSVIEHETRIVDALVSDFGHRSRDASRWVDVAAIVEGAKYCKKHLGGVGPSGTGAYHAREGFLTFSHARSVFTDPKINLLGRVLRPPFGERYRKLVARMLRP